MIITKGDHENRKHGNPIPPMGREILRQKLWEFYGNVKDENRNENVFPK